MVSEPKWQQQEQMASEQKFQQLSIGRGMWNKKKLQAMATINRSAVNR
jgi:hypothetical protein